MLRTLASLLLFIAPLVVAAQPVISYDTVVSALSQPVDVEEVNDSSHRLFIVEKTGTIRIWNGSSLQPAPFLNVASIISVASERGLLSMAFHPAYLTNGIFFIYYTNVAGDITIARYNRFNTDSADAASGVVLMNIPKRFANHNGGNLAFGQDGYMYFGTGDGGSGGDPDNNAQNGSSLLGKMLRIDINRSDTPYYNIPADNPYFGSTTVKQEIIATGLRNPWRWSFDRQTGDMWIADVGQDSAEEVNVVSAANRLNTDYGWSCYEGTRVFKSGCSAQANNVFPVYTYPHNNTSGGYSVTGGFVYRGSEFPDLQGYYLFTDFVTGNLWLTRSDGAGGYTTSMQNNLGGISSFGEAADGTLYATALDGTLFKVVTNSTLPVRLLSFSGTQASNKYVLSWSLQNEEAGDVYVLEKRTDIRTPFTELTRIKATENRTANRYSITEPLPAEQTYYRLRIISGNQQVLFSNIVSVNGNNKPLFKAYISGTNINLTLPVGTTNIELYDASGKSFQKVQIKPATTNANIPLHAAAKGIIIVRALINNEWQAVRVLYTPGY